MQNHIDLTPSYVLHTRPFRNTSLSVEFFSEKYGRVSAVARSARGMTSRYQNKLQLFTPLLASWSGQHELKSLGNIELNGMPLQLNHQPLFCAFYLNELLMRVLHKEDPHSTLFEYYHDALIALEKNNNIAEILRLFEKRLLGVLGYAFHFEKINPDAYYYFDQQHGFIVCDNQSEFLGADLLLISQDKFESEAVLKAAKKLMRLALAPLIGERPLNSRVFF